MLGDNADGAANAPDSYGVETVDAYVCQPECPVRLLGEQSGESKSPKPYHRNVKGKR